MIPIVHKVIHITISISRSIETSCSIVMTILKPCFDTLHFAQKHPYGTHACVDREWFTTTIPGFLDSDRLQL